LILDATDSWRRGVPYGGVNGSINGFGCVQFSRWRRSFGLDPGEVLGTSGAAGKREEGVRALPEGSLAKERREGRAGSSSGGSGAPRGNLRRREKKEARGNRCCARGSAREVGEGNGRLARPWSGLKEKEERSRRWSALGFTVVGTRVQMVGERRDLALQRIGILHCGLDTTESRRGRGGAKGEAAGVLERAPDRRAAGIGVPMARRAMGLCTTLPRRYTNSRRLDTREEKR